MNNHPFDEPLPRETLHKIIDELEEEKKNSMTIKKWQKEIYINAKKHGQWGEYYKNIPVKLCLIHSEISEALEALRKGKDTRCKGWIGEELADAVIRILDLAEYLGVDLEYEIKRKHKINLKRPYKHGKKF